MTAGEYGVIDLLLRDHEKTRALLARLDSTPDEELEEYFHRLREQLLRHEAAEELVVYPAFRNNVPWGAETADACIDEQAKAEETIAALQATETTRDAFRAQLETLRANVQAHATREEAEVFPALGANTEREQLRKLAERYEKALAAAPSYPHPHAPDRPPWNKVTSPVASLIDHMRDAIAE